MYLETGLIEELDVAQWTRVLDDQPPEEFLRLLLTDCWR